MNSALKPVGVSASSVPQQLNKSLHQTATYGQPLSNIPQNLVNLPHSASTPANAHSNNIHTANHLSVNTTNVPQSHATGGSVPPPSNHPVASVNQSPPSKNITYSSNTNSVVHSYKLASAPTIENTPPSLNAVTEESSIEKPQSNGPFEQKCNLEKESLQSHQTEIIIKDKPPPHPQAIDAPTAIPINFEKPKESSKITSVPEKPAETVTPVSPAEQTVQNIDVTKTVPEGSTSSKPEGPSEGKTVKPTSVNVQGTIESIASKSPSVETSTALNVITTVAINTYASKVEKIAETVNTATVPKTTELTTNIKPAVMSNLNSPVNRPKEQVIAKSPLKLAPSQRSPVRKNKMPETTDQVKITKTEVKTFSQKPQSSIAKTIRTRTRTQPYQSPLPEVEMISKISASASTSKFKNVDDRLIVFYKNEFLALRNPDGGFYICQALHNIYKSTRKLRILWLTQDKSDGDIYTPDFYDQTDFDCILTNINLIRLAKGKFKLPDKERIRTDSILKRALAVEKGDSAVPSPTEEHPDGLDLSLFKEESQLRKRKRRKRKVSPTKTHKSSEISKSPNEAKVRKIDPKPRPPSVTKALVLKKALSSKAKEITAVNVNKPVKTKPAEFETFTVTKTSAAVDQKKDKGVGKVIKKLVTSIQPVQLQPSSSMAPQTPRKQSMKSTDTVVPFLRKESPPVLKKEVPSKKDYLVLKDESALLKKGTMPVKKEIPPKRNLDVSRKEFPVAKHEMPVLKREVISAVKKEVPPHKQVLTRKSSRGKK